MPSNNTVSPAPPPKDGNHSRSKTSPPTSPDQVGVKRSSNATTKSELPEPPVNILQSTQHETPPQSTNKKGGSKQILKMTVAPVQVCVRVRPVTPMEALKKDNSICVESLQQMNRIRIKNTKEKPPTREFTYDSVFGVDQNQQTLYETMVRNLIAKCLDGYNGCIFAYGQTASGKTFTIQGPQQASPEQYGVLQRVAVQIITGVEDSKKKDSSIETSIKVSYMEIYNEKLVDLLAGEEQQSELKIRQEPDGNGHFVQGLTERGVGTLKELMNVHAVGAKNRTVAETNMNEASSRSHAIFTISIVEKRKDVKSDRIAKKTSKIHIIDLAGSERADSTGATGVRLKEGAAINQSLSALGNVINALAKPAGERGHVPYRDSKLTYLLSDSLGGNSLTLMISCISPTLSNYDESISTLRFAERVKTIKNHAKINMDPLMLRIMELEAELEEMRQKARKCTCGAMESEFQGGGCMSFSLFRGKASSKVKPVVQEDSNTSPKAIDKDTPPPPKPPKVLATKELN